MKTHQSVKNLWKDPVWSKVIAGVILGVISYFLGILTLLLEWVATAILWACKFLAASPFALVSLVLASALIAALAKLKKLSPKKTGHLTGIEWFRSLSNDELARYFFLLWFPIHRRRRTQIYPKRLSFDQAAVSFDHIPEVRELMRRNILKYVNEGIGEYSLEIDADVYRHLEQASQDEQNASDQNIHAIYKRLSRIPFDAVFPNSRQ